LDIKSFNAEKGFGFINCPDLFATYSRDVFMHKSVFEETGLTIGAAATFQIFLNQQGQPQALNLQAL